MSIIQRIERTPSSRRNKERQRERENKIHVDNIVNFSISEFVLIQQTMQTIANHHNNNTIYTIIREVYIVHIIMCQ